MGGGGTSRSSGSRRVGRHPRQRGRVTPAVPQPSHPARPPCTAPRPPQSPTAPRPPSSDSSHRQPLPRPHRERRRRPAVRPRQPWRHHRHRHQVGHRGAPVCADRRCAHPAPRFRTSPRPARPPPPREHGRQPARTQRVRHPDPPRPPRPRRPEQLHVPAPVDADATAPAAATRRAARSTAQPLTIPVGSRRPWYDVLNQPSLTRSASAASSSTPATSGAHASTVSAPRASREIWLPSR